MASVEKEIYNAALHELFLRMLVNWLFSIKDIPTSEVGHRTRKAEHYSTSLIEFSEAFIVD
jgi:hypothetical protein